MRLCRKNSIIREKIYQIRGRKVLLDFDLAVFYEVETRQLNQAVNRNLSRFPEDFFFRITKDEYDNLKSQFVISFGVVDDLKFSSLLLFHSFYLSCVEAGVCFKKYRMLLIKICRVLLISTLFLLGGTSCILQRNMSSGIYNREGKLIVNDNFHVSISQLKKFSAIENPLMDTLLSFISFPTVYRENGIPIDEIVEFRLDRNGQATDVSITRVTSCCSVFDESSFKKEFQSYYYVQLNAALRSINKEHEFKGREELFYIPIQFSFGKKSEKKVEGGWLHIIEPPVLLKGKPVN